MVNNSVNSKGEKAKRIIGVILFVTLIISLIYVLIAMVNAPLTPPPDDPNATVKGDYLLRLTQCVLALVVMFVPSLLEKKFSISIYHDILFQFGFRLDIFLFPYMFIIKQAFAQLLA